MLESYRQLETSHNELINGHNQQYETQVRGEQDAINELQGQIEHLKQVNMRLTKKSETVDFERAQGASMSVGDLDINASGKKAAAPKEKRFLLSELH